MCSIKKLESALLWSMLIGLAAAGHAAVLPVPSEYPTIQSALDATEAGDTVLVSPGVYHEFLVGTLHSVTLLGEFQADTTEELRALIDPIAAGLDTPSTFVARGDTTTVKNIAFFNRPELRQSFATRSGGVQNLASALFIENCRFDSVSAAIRGGMDIKVTDCRFLGCVRDAIRPSTNGRVQVNRCWFEVSAYAMVTGYSNSRIEDCEFTRNAQLGHFVEVIGEDITMRNCRFGPSVTAFTVLVAFPMGNVRIENNLFEGIENAMWVIEVGVNCSMVEDPPIVISNNIFRNNRMTANQSGMIQINANCMNQTSGNLAVIEDNEFVDCLGLQHSLATGIYLNGAARLTGNTFLDLQPQDLPDVLASGGSQNPVIARNNSFLPQGLAARGSGDNFDARENWWGDSTGPFHSVLNPNGMGSEVGNGVEFIPWLTSPPDSADTSEVSANEMLPILPSEFRLEVFPNPFNAVAQLSIFVRTPGIYDVVLYDVTGREAVRIHAGYIRSKCSVRLDMNRLASGVYFAALHAHDKTLATTKLLLLR